MAPEKLLNLPGLLPDTAGSPQFQVALQGGWASSRRKFRDSLKPRQQWAAWSDGSPKIFQDSDVANTNICKYLSASQYVQADDYMRTRLIRSDLIWDETQWYDIKS